MKIAVLICGLVFDSQKAIMKGIERKVREYEDVCSVFCCHVNVSGSNAYSDGEYSIFELPDFSSFDGIIIVRNTFRSTDGLSNILARIRKSKVPCVCIDGEDKHFINIVSNEKESVRELTDHMIEVHNCKKLFFLAGTKGGADSISRYEGFIESLKNHDITFHRKYVFEGNYEYTSGVNAVAYYLDELKEIPDAIVCANDQMAVGVINELMRRNIKVPKDVKVTGVDYDYSSRLLSPRLTTIKRQQYMKGLKAIDILHNLDEYELGENVFLPISIRVAESCGCKCTEDKFSDLDRNMSVELYQKAELTQLVKRMTADLMSQSEYISLINYMREYALNLKPNELYLCLNLRPETQIDYNGYNAAMLNESDGSERSYTDSMINIISIQNGEANASADGEEFNRFDLFPPKANGGRKGVTYYFYPIHYLDRNYGYAILGGSGELIRSDFFPNWAMMSSNAFENFRKQSIMEQMIHALDRMWIYDTLTGVYNRAGFFKLAEPIIEECVNNNKKICVVFLDLDGLKKVNDQYGHDEGDTLIKSIAGVMKQVKRHGELLMRYGGDEFVILAPGYTKKDAALCIDTINEKMEEFNKSSEKPYKLEASIGYHMATVRNTDELNAVIEQADQEMYTIKKQKKAGKNEAK